MAAYYEPPRPEDKPKPEIVTDKNGTPFRSLPKSKRAAARKAVKKQLDKQPWTDANVDPDEQRHFAHRVSNAQHRQQPTRAESKRREIDSQE